MEWTCIRLLLLIGVIVFAIVACALTVSRTARVTRLSHSVLE
jgi:hypothetical protein